MDKNTAEEIAIQYLESGDERVKLNAAAFLAETGSDDALKAVTKVLRGSERESADSLLRTLLHSAPRSFSVANAIRAAAPRETGGRIVAAIIVTVIATVLLWLGLSAFEEPNEEPIRSALITIFVVALIAGGTLASNARPIGGYPSVISGIAVELRALSITAAIVVALLTGGLVLSGAMAAGKAPAFAALFFASMLALRVGSALTVYVTNDRSPSLALFTAGAAVLGAAVALAGLFILRKTGVIGDARLGLWALGALPALASGAVCAAMADRAVARLGAMVPAGLPNGWRIGAAGAGGLAAIVLACIFLPTGSDHALTANATVNGEPVDADTPVELQLGKPVELHVRSPEAISLQLESEDYLGDLYMYVYDAGPRKDTTPILQGAAENPTRLYRTDSDEGDYWNVVGGGPFDGEEVNELLLGNPETVTNPDAEARRYWICVVLYSNRDQEGEECVERRNAASSVRSLLSGFARMALFTGAPVDETNVLPVDSDAPLQLSILIDEDRTPDNGDGPLIATTGDDARFQPVRLENAEPANRAGRGGGSGSGGADTNENSYLAIVTRVPGGPYDSYRPGQIVRVDSDALPFIEVLPAAAEDAPPLAYDIMRQNAREDDRNDRFDEDEDDGNDRLIGQDDIGGREFYDLLRYEGDELDCELIAAASLYSRAAYLVDVETPLVCEFETENPVAQTLQNRYLRTLQYGEAPVDYEEAAEPPAPGTRALALTDLFDTGELTRGTLVEVVGVYETDRGPRLALSSLMPLEDENRRVFRARPEALAGYAFFDGSADGLQPTEVGAVYDLLGEIDEAMWDGAPDAPPAPLDAAEREQILAEIQTLSGVEVFSGVRRRVDINDLGEWSVCYTADYNDTTPFTRIEANCDAEQLLVACARDDDPDLLIVAAMGERDEVFKPTDDDETHDHNNVQWYRTPGAFGFGAVGDDLALNSCDVNDGPDRLCWHKDEDANGGDLETGYKCGEREGNPPEEDGFDFIRYVFEGDL